MSSKNKTILLLNSLIVISVVVVVLIFDTFLSDMVDNLILKTILLVFIALLIYLTTAFQLLLKDNRELQDMVENTIHELNTPISTIKANASMLEKTLTDPKDQIRVKRIKQASKNLITLYENIEYKIKKEIDFVELSNFNIREIVDESISKFEYTKNNIEISNQLKDYIVLTDKIGFSSVIDNLISNAIKYNRDNGFIKIYNKNKKLIIEDSGMGIDTKSLFTIFDRYYQYNSNVQGLGLGLSIVKKFCDKYKIEIKIDSKEGVGTKIALDLTNIISH